MFTPILLILLSLLFQRTQVDSLESFQVRFQQRKHFCDAPFVGGFHVQRKHRIVQGLPQEEPTGVAVPIVIDPDTFVIRLFQGKTGCFCNPIRHAFQNTGADFHKILPIQVEPDFLCLRRRTQCIDQGFDVLAFFFQLSGGGHNQAGQVGTVIQVVVVGIGGMAGSLDGQEGILAFFF